MKVETVCCTCHCDPTGFNPSSNTNLALRQDHQAACMRASCIVALPDWSVVAFSKLVDSRGFDAAMFMDVYARRRSVIKEIALEL